MRMRRTNAAKAMVGKPMFRCRQEPAGKGARSSQESGRKIARIELENLEVELVDFDLENHRD